MYPLVLREKIYMIKEREQLSFAEAGKRFGVHPRTIQRWKQRIEPILKRNKPATKINMKILAEDVRKNPDAYQYERAQKFKVSPNAILYALRRLNITYKKNSVSSQSKRNRKNPLLHKNKKLSGTRNKHRLH